MGTISHKSHIKLRISIWQMDMHNTPPGVTSVWGRMLELDKQLYKLVNICEQVSLFSLSRWSRSREGLSNTSNVTCVSFVECLSNKVNRARSWFWHQQLNTKKKNLCVRGLSFQNTQTLVKIVGNIWECASTLTDFKHRSHKVTGTHTKSKRIRKQIRNQFEIEGTARWS